MGRKPRSQEIIETEVGTYHVITRTVSRAFLMGDDPVNGLCFDGRRRWLLARLIWLAPRFKIDIISFSLMANHLHLVLRNRPDLVENMSDEELIRAWWDISPKYRKNGEPGPLTPKRLRKLLNDQDHIDSCRERLSSISWFMRYLKHPLAISANKVDHRSGHFFEARYRVKPIKSLAQLSHTMVYTDLNPVRAGLAMSVPESEFTSAQLRLKAIKRRRKLRKKGTDHAKRELRKMDEKQTLDQHLDNWLSPIQMQDDEPIIVRKGTNQAETDQETTQKMEQASTPKSTTSHASKPYIPVAQRRRCSERGVLPISDEQYLKLLDMVGRQTKAGKGHIPHGMTPIVAELGCESAEKWLADHEAYAESIDDTYADKANTDKEAGLVDIKFADATKTNQDAMM